MKLIILITWYHPNIRFVWMKKQVMRLKADDSCLEEKSSRISSVKGIPSKHSLFQLRQSALPTKGNESGSSPIGILPTPVMLPTPTASDAGAAAVISDSDQYIQNSNGNWRKVNRNGVNGSVSLARMGKMALLPTPTTNDSKNATLPESQRNRNGIAGEILRNTEISGKDFQLNALYVEEMMGFPKGWTLIPFRTKDGGMKP